MFWDVMSCQQVCVSDISEECSVFKSRGVQAELKMLGTVGDT
jgi:hypothetical protein